jgi:hypothetical protein
MLTPKRFNTQKIIGSGDRCTCICHSTDAKGIGPVFHSVACCSTCPYCGADRIKINSYSAHVKDCSQNPENSKTE